ncbi:MAG TPA: hypothetical protein VG818_09685 [Gemmatimonadaceae bacterium]|jgi:hypothetical protein|nr:hypothetical protein [Gemmatimonadaceae bacterium]
MKILQWAALATTASLAACASAGPKPETPVGAGFGAKPGAVMWSASFQSTMLRSSATLGSGQERMDGTVEVAATDRPDVFKVHIVLNTLRNGDTMGWSLLTGRCGNDAPPLVQPRQLQQLDIQDTGRGELSAEFPAALHAGAEYHLNIYENGGNQLSDVVTCANLKSVAH